MRNEGGHGGGLAVGMDRLVHRVSQLTGKPEQPQHALALRIALRIAHLPGRPRCAQSSRFVHLAAAAGAVYATPGATNAAAAAANAGAFFSRAGAGRACGRSHGQRIAHKLVHVLCGHGRPRDARARAGCRA